MQYWKPLAENRFAGDMMPYFEGGQFHVFYLLDENHHAEEDGLGGHQWAHASSADLIEWDHHPLALPKGVQGELDQRGICTGSIFKWGDNFYAFYATRIKSADDSVREVICGGMSTDLEHFVKFPRNPLFGASTEFDPQNHRDPFVFVENGIGRFHMLVTASVPKGPDELGECGALAHYISDNLFDWEVLGKFIELDADPSPECPELFEWNGWWYLIYSQHGVMQYRVSRQQMGPWTKVGTGTVEGPNLTVPRTAAWKNGTRLAVGFLPWKAGDCDEGDYVYAGNVVFRELKQHEDGTLATSFVEEMSPELAFVLEEHRIEDAGEIEAVTIGKPGADCYQRLKLVPDTAVTDYGLVLRANEELTTGYRLVFSPRDSTVSMSSLSNPIARFRNELYDVESLEIGLDVEIRMTGSVIDICINGQRTSIERCFDQQGDWLGAYSRGGAVRVTSF